MTDTASTAEGSTSLPDLIFYTRDGCHLCDETRDLLALLFAERVGQGKRVPPIIERDITANEDWLRAYFTSIPVVELDDRRVELATSPVRLRRVLEDVLDTQPATALSNPSA
jgi:hypothetical protein